MGVDVADELHEKRQIFSERNCNSIKNEGSRFCNMSRTYIFGNDTIFSGFDAVYRWRKYWYLNWLFPAEIESM